MCRSSTRACAATATCRCVWANSGPATGTSPRAPCTASCASAVSPRMTATSSAPRRRSSRKWRISSTCCSGTTATSDSATSQVWEEVKGEGAFYGPKVEFSLKDWIGRVWQCGTIQVDFSMPGRLGAEYVDEDNTRKVPVMLHRAILGSMERFIGILIEHYAGAMPLWLAPLQVVALNISGGQAEYTAEVAGGNRPGGVLARAEF